MSSPRGARANEADLVVVNHHLLLADLALKEEGFGDILPSADAVILDEAHQLPDLAAQFFGAQFSSRKVEQLLSDLPTLLLQSGFLRPDQLARSNGSCATRCSRAVQRSRPRRGRPGRRAPGATAWPRVDAAARALVAALCDLADALRGTGWRRCAAATAQRAPPQLAGELDASCRRGTADGRAPAGRRQPRVSLPAAALRHRRHAARDMRRGRWPGSSPRPRWRWPGILALHADAWACRPQRHAVHRQPVRLCAAGAAVSAAGLPDPRDAGLSLTPSCTARRRWSSSRRRRVPAVHQPSRAGSTRRARCASAGIGEAGGAFHLLVQGESPREQLLREFREHGDAVLLGTASFWEGVDVQGQCAAPGGDRPPAVRLAGRSGDARAPAACARARAAIPSTISSCPKRRSR